MSCKGLATGLCLFVAMAGILFAQENDFTISKNLPDFNRYPKLSFGADGKVFVAWYDSPTWGSFYSPIYTALCIPGNEGIYKVTKPRQITISGRLIRTLDMAYNPEGDSWLVAWWELGNTSQTDQNYEIVTRKFNAKGKASGSQKNITHNLDTNDRQPVVAYMPSSVSSPAGSKGGYLLAWDSRVGTDLAHPGIFSVHLDDRGLPITGTSKLVRKAHMVNGSLSPSEHQEMIRTADGKYVLAGKDWILKSGESAAYYPLLLRMDSSGAFDAELLPDSPKLYHIRVTQITPKNLLLSWITINDTRICLVKDKNLKNKKVQTYAESAFKQPTILKIIKLGNDPGSILLLSNSWTMYGVHYDQRGKPDQVPQVLFNAGGYIDFFDAACIPGTNSVFIAYGVSHGDSIELRGCVIDVLE